MTRQRSSRVRAAALRRNALDGSFGGLSQQRLQLGEGVLDRVEVGTVGRQEAEPRTSGLDGFADDQPLVGRQVVEDHDIAGPQRGIA